MVVRQTGTSCLHVMTCFESSVPVIRGRRGCVKSVNVVLQWDVALAVMSVNDK